MRGPVDHQHFLFSQRYFVLAPGLASVVDLARGYNEIKARISNRMARGRRAQRNPLYVWLPAGTSCQSLFRVCLSNPVSLLLFRRSRQTAHVTSIRTRTRDRSRHRRDVYLGRRQFLRSLNSSIDYQKRLVWLVIGAYSLLTAILITFGRSSFGVVQSLSSRYTTFTIYLPVALVYLFTIEVRSGPATRVYLEHRFAMRADCGDCNNTDADAVLLFCRALCERARRKDIQVKTCVLLTNVIDDRCLTDQGYPTPGVFQQLANQAENGLLRPALIKKRNARDLAPWDFAVSNTDNSFVEVSQTADHE